MLMVRTVRHLPTALHVRPDQIGAIAFSVVAVAGLSAYIYFNRKPDPEEVERLRRLFLAQQGRITDATLVDLGLEKHPDPNPIPDHVPGAIIEEAPPAVLRYQYKVGGVGYESLQDVSLLADHVRHIRVDLPIQVRYDPKNPGNSIVVAESWTGLRLGPEHRSTNDYPLPTSH